MKHWQITKYNPAYRDNSGAYRREDWTSFDDIGHTFGGTVLTVTDYIQMEDCYVNTAIHFAHAAGVTELVVSELELRNSRLDVSEGLLVNVDKTSDIIRSILRCRMWCKLEHRPIFYLHFGYDYYMYIGNKFALPESVRYAKDRGLFIEEYASPYLRWD